MGKFVIKGTKNGGFKFDLLAANQQIIANSQVYKSMRSLKNGIASVVKNFMAAVEDQTVEPVVAVKCPKYEIYKDKAGEFRFRLKASNGQIIAVGEGYTAKAGCLNGIDSIGRNAPDAEVAKEEE
ncbi:MAG: YegP family protein [Spirochaetales bacterium]|nr:YegP family protein [Spirochaetales bacterium]